MPEKSFEEQSIEQMRLHGQWEIRSDQWAEAQPSQTLLQKGAELISGKESSEFDIEWVQENITSIQEAVKNGKHEVMFYPASGRDLLRVILAYDLYHLIVVDIDEYHAEEMASQLKEVGIPYKTIPLKDRKGKEIVFTIDGKDRKVTHIIGDARTNNLQTFGLEQVDILHVYLPTGADSAVKADEAYLQAKYGDEWYMKQWDDEARSLMNADPDAPKPNPTSNEYDIVIPAVNNDIDSTNYQTVREGGFFVFGERRLQRTQTLPSLYRIAGLKEYQITRRHPFTVLTALYPNKDELKEMNRNGYIYQKECSVNPEIIDILNEIFMTQYWTEYSFFEFERGSFVYVGIEDDQPIDVVSAIQAHYQDLKNSVTEYARRLHSAGVSSDDANDFQQEMLLAYREKIDDLQRRVKEMLQTYDEVSRQYEAGQLNDAQAKEKMGIVFKRNIANQMEPLNTTYPLAVQIILGNDATSPRAEEVAYQFANASFEFQK
jgi:hypothetical protein